MNVYQRFQEFSADYSIPKKLSWIDKSTWVSILNLSSMVDQRKISSQ